MTSTKLHWILFLSFCIWFGTKSAHYIHRYTALEHAYAIHLQQTDIIQKKLQTRLFATHSHAIDLPWEPGSPPLLTRALVQLESLTLSRPSKTLTITPRSTTKP